jgi:hypothetical protein
MKTKAEFENGLKIFRKKKPTKAELEKALEDILHGLEIFKFEIVEGLAERKKIPIAEAVKEFLEFKHTTEKLLEISRARE